MLKLDQNELPWDLPIEFKQAVTQKLLESNWSRYPSEDLSFLEQILAQKVGVPSSHLLITPASAGFIEYFFNYYIDNHYLQPSLTYFRYSKIASSLNKTPIYYPLENNENYNPLILKKYRISNPTLPYIICSPNNPTGSLLDLGSIIEITSLAQSYVLLDSTYIWFSDIISPSYFSRLLLLPNLFQIFSFSKAFSAAAVRVGFAIVPPNVKKQYLTTQNPFKLNAFARAFLEVLLSENWWKEALAKIERIKLSRQMLFNSLSSLSWLKVLPSQANFLMIHIPSKADEIANFLASEQVIVKKLGESDIRITLCDPSDCSKIINLFNRITDSLPPYLVKPQALS